MALQVLFFAKFFNILGQNKFLALILILLDENDWNNRDICDWKLSVIWLFQNYFENNSPEVTENLDRESEIWILKFFLKFEKY